ncbi:ankyrin repeat domain-containing protein [Desulfobotulus mexicanus]|uniref:Ankyrin repeat domain-containing protein n=1 Tax=Desulfobotulus mexicanus TaxID=2586642 RepID=A0A5S5MFC0_9BACT|nr:ankyrin repeat domain-containing protein [Desulfobotulus mexicanus]TYT74390.1 ankyrin repeat domain-containing protein [Desulfobotulus mexicanus]
MKRLKSSLVLISISGILAIYVLTIHGHEKNNPAIESEPSLMLNTNPSKKLHDNQRKMTPSHPDFILSSDLFSTNETKNEPDNKIESASFPPAQVFQLIKESSAEDILLFYKKHKTDINISLSGSIQAPIFHFLLHSNFEVAKKLFSLGIIDIDKTPGAVKMAVFSDDPEILKFLLAAGWSPDASTEGGMSPILSSIFLGKLDTARFLEAEGADLHGIFKDKNALDLAVSSSRMDTQTLDYLLENGMRYKPEHAVDAAMRGASVSLSHLLANHPELAATQKNDQSLMDLAVAGTAGVETIQILLHNGLSLTEAHLRATEKRVKGAYIHPDTGRELILPQDRKAEELQAFIAHYLAIN